MGRTVLSQRIVIDSLRSELGSFAKVLRGPDKEIFESLLKKPLSHAGAISYTSSFHVWAFMLLAIILEQEKKILELENGKR